MTGGAADLSDSEKMELAERFADASAVSLLAWANERFGQRAAIAASFGIEDVVLIDLAAQHAPQLRVFTLDTGRLHPETYELMEAMRLRYELELQTYVPAQAALEAFETAQGYFSFRQSVEHRQACCRLRKVEPLGRALAGCGAWVTGLRRAQGPTRVQVQPLEWDAAHGGIAKLNPLAAWSSEEIWAYATARQLPHHPLHDRGFPSIGCAPCTRAVQPGEDPRAGRWWWESRHHKECGLHPSAGSAEGER